MQIFRIRQDGFREIRKQMLVRIIPFMIIIGAVGITIGMVNSKDKETDVNVLPVVIPVTSVMIGFGLYRGVNRQRALFESYTLTIEDNLITREQLNTPEISLYITEIMEIVKHRNGSFIIKGKTPGEIIMIPAQIDNYTELETTLQKMHPITIKENLSFLEKYQSLTGLIGVGLMLAVYTVNNKIVVALTGTAIIVLMVWSFIKIRGSKNVDSKTRNSSWWILIVLASVIAVMIFKLGGFAGR